MKKMFIAATIVCMTMFVQAGSVVWGTVAMYGDNDAKVKSSATFYVYMLADKAAYDGLSDIWGTYGEDIKAGGAGATISKKAGAATSKASVFAPDGTATANTTYYAALITTIGSGENMKYYAEKAFKTTGDDGNADYTFGVGALDSAAAAKTAWTSATAPVTPPGPGSDPSGIPEPTSGLLLVMGGALLVLRRKQK